jgi:hypothetical protein
MVIIFSSSVVSWQANYNYKQNACSAILKSHKRQNVDVNEIKRRNKASHDRG